MFGERHRVRAAARELALADHLDQFDAGEDGAGGTESFEVEHRPSYPLDGPVIPEFLRSLHPSRYRWRGQIEIADALLKTAAVARIEIDDPRVRFVLAHTQRFAAKEDAKREV